MRTLQHYTSREGLQGIAKSKSFWATNILDVNDKSELVYGYVEMSMRALRSTWEAIAEYLPREEDREQFDFDGARKKIYETYRVRMDETASAEQLYVTSFARPRSEHQQSRGILTLWDRYTNNRGYCLEYDSEEVQALLDREGTRRNYAVLDLREVCYGIREEDCDYREIQFQLKQNFLGEVERARIEIGIHCDYERLWAFSAFETRMLSYCAMHKDPFFEDEREVRIIAIPVDKTESRPFVGLALKKTVKTTPYGKRYIDLGEDWSPGIEPRRIIVGPNASDDLDDIIRRFDRLPQVVKMEFPI